MDLVPLFPSLKKKGNTREYPWQGHGKRDCQFSASKIKMHFSLSHITRAPSLGITWGWSIAHTLWHPIRDSSMCEWAYSYGMSSCGLIELKVANYHHRLVNFDVPHALPFLVQWESTHNFKIIVFNTKKLTKVMTYFLPKSKWIT